MVSASDYFHPTPPSLFLCSFQPTYLLLSIITFISVGSLATQQKFTMGFPYYEAEEPYVLTCYFCVNVSGNNVCNLFAIDTPCKEGLSFCKTTHIMDMAGESILVDKKCTSSEECTPLTVGCKSTLDEKTCVSCCDLSLCNESVPTNDHNAIYNRTRSSGQRRKASLQTTVSTMLATLVMWMWTK